MCKCATTAFVLLMFAFALALAGCSDEVTKNAIDADGGAAVDASSNADGSLPDSCGASGDVAQRIASCSSRRCVSSDLTLVDCAQPHAFEWELVAREHLTEVWRDVATGIVWGGDHLLEPSDQAGAVNGCMQPGRCEAGLSLTFRLPAIEDFELAASHGIRNVIQSFDDLVWWSSSSTVDGKAWAYAEGERRAMDPKTRDEYFRYRCVTGG